MHVHLGAGEALLPGTREALALRFEDPTVGAVLLPLVPEGEGGFPRAARRYLAAWDRRFLHPQNYFAPASRVAARETLPGPRNAEAAPHLSGLLEKGLRVEALAAGEGGVSTPIASDLQAWVLWASSEGQAWGALAARDARFRGFLPSLSWSGWWRHNLFQAQRRAVEVMQAARGPFAGGYLLHATREAAWTGGCVRGFSSATPPR